MKDYRWKTVSSEQVDQNPFWSHWRDFFRTPRGREGEYHYTTHRDAVGVIGQLDDGRFVMIVEYRYLFDKLSLAMAQGGREEGETPPQVRPRIFRSIPTTCTAIGIGRMVELAE